MAATSEWFHRRTIVLVDCAVLSAAGLLMLSLLHPHEPSVEDPAKARRKEQAAALVREMLARDGSNVPSQLRRPLKLNDHEIEVASSMPFRVQQGVNFSSIGGLDEQIKQLRRALLLPIQRPNLFRKSRLLQPPKGVLLHGSPGTGKTMLARAVANEAKYTFICLDPARLLSKWYGESNKLAEAYFTLAHKLAPAIIFIDEIDCLFPKHRGGGEHEATVSLRAQFLALWDGMLSPHSSEASASLIVVMAATNCASNIDPAILRRLPLQLEVPMPDEGARAEVLRCVLGNEAMARELDVHALARECAGYSGSDLEALCRTAAMRPLDEMLAREHTTESRVRNGQDAATSVEGQGDARRDPPGTENITSAEGRRTCFMVHAQGHVPNVALRQALRLRRRTVSTVQEEPETELRPLTMDDFRAAMQVVRPSASRFSPSWTPGPLATPPIGDDVDLDLYD